jgi:hypothetical protein
MAAEELSCVAKHRRAQTHLHALRDEVSIFLDDNPYEIVAERDDERSQYVFRVTGIKPPPADLGLVIGDCIHNLRSALDHLAYDLAVLGVLMPRDGPSRDLTDDEARSVEFPIFNESEKFANNGAQKVRLLRAGEQTRIRELQPFNAWDMSIWGRNVPAAVPQAIERLHALEIRDKHRTLHATWQAVTVRLTIFTPLWEQFRALPGIKGGQTFGHELQDGAQVGYWQFDGAVPDLPSEMDVKAHFPISVSFGEPWPPLDGVGVLEAMSEAVAFIIGAFAPALLNHQPALPLSARRDPVSALLLPEGATDVWTPPEF